uniref:Uncharacterized protein n=1 Tax=Magallana gigas TaxID=29159 RepID=K1QWP4_MAGGI
MVNGERTQNGNDSETRAQCGRIIRRGERKFEYLKKEAELQKEKLESEQEEIIHKRSNGVSYGGNNQSTKYTYLTRPFTSINIMFEIRDITLDDAGYYNGGSSAEAAWSGGGVVLVVKDKPSTPVITGDLDVEVNRYITLNCSSISTSAPDYYAKLVTLSYTWFVNDTKMDRETRDTIRFNRPQQPLNFMAYSYASGYVNMTWTSGFNGGSEQFFILRMRDDTDWKIIANLTDPGKGGTVNFEHGPLTPGQEIVYRLESYSAKTEVLVNYKSRVEVSRQLSFSYQKSTEDDHDSAGEKFKTLKEVQNTPEFNKVAVEVKILSAKEVSVQIVRELPIQKQEVIVGDSTATMKLTLWDEIVTKLEIGKSYRLNQLSTRLFQNAPEDNDVIEKEGKITQVGLVMHFSCEMCKGKVALPDDDSKFIRCPSCKMKMAKETLQKSMNGTLCFSYGYQKLPEKYNLHRAGGEVDILLLGLTIDVTEVERSQGTDNEEDEDYEPSFDITLREGMDITIAPDDHDDEDDVEEESEDFQPACLSSTCNRIETCEEVQKFPGDHPCITYCSQLLNLARMNMPETCTNKDCGAEVEVVKEVVVSAVYLIWVWLDKKFVGVDKGCSKPLLVYCTNFLISRGLSAEICNKDTGEKARLRQRSRGHFLCVTGGGHITYFDPIFKSESPSQILMQVVYLMYLELKDVPEEDLEEAMENYILCYDNMCQLDSLKATKEDLTLPPPFHMM